MHDLQGRMYESKTLKLNREKWHQFPFYYKPYRPYRIIKDLTIMPGATLTIEKGVEVSDVFVSPNTLFFYYNFDYNYIYIFMDKFIQIYW